MPKRTNKRISITYTALIWLGILLCLIGVGLTVFGIGGSATSEFSWDKFTLKTSQIGLIFMVVGAVLAGVVAVKVPKDVVILGGAPGETLTEVVARNIRIPALLVTLIALVLLIVSVTL